jgi:hypothetical protein
MDSEIQKFYSGQLGGSLPFFAGSNHQFGGGILQTIGRFALPIFKRLIGVGTNVAEDMIEGRKTFKDSVIDNAISEVSNIVVGKATKRKRNTKTDNFGTTTKKRR